MTDNVHIVVQEAGAGLVARSFDDIANAAMRAHTATGALQRAITAIGRSGQAATQLGATGRAAAAAATQVTSLNAAITALNQNAIRSLTPLPGIFNNVRNGAMGAAGGMNLFMGTFATAAGLFGVVKMLKDAQIAFQEIHYGLVAATGSSTLAGREFDYVRNVSDRLGLSLQSAAKEYSRLSASATAMNVKFEDQHRLYEGLAKASTVLHLSQDKVQFATLALTQMFSKGRIQAEELRRQLGEHIPGVVPRFQKAVMEVVKGTSLAGMSFDDLMKKGLLNTKQFLPQLAQALEETGRGWEGAAKGLNAEINRLSTSWFNLKVDMSEGLFTKGLTAGVRFLAQNLDGLTSVTMGLGTTLALAFSPLIINQFTTALRAAWVAAAANPLLAVAAVLAGVTVALVSARDEIKLFMNDNSTLGNLMSVIWDDFRTVATTAADEAAKAVKGLGATNSNTFAGMLDELNGYENANMSTWLKIVRVVLKAVDAIGAAIRGVFVGATNVVIEQVKTWMGVFGTLANQMKLITSGEFGAAFDLGKANLDNVLSFGTRAADAFAKGWNDSFASQSTGGLVATMDDWVNRAVNQASKAAKPVTPVLDPDEEEDPASPGKKKKKKKKTGKTEAQKAAEVLMRLQNELAANLANYTRELDQSLNTLYMSKEAQNYLQGVLDNYKWYEGELRQLRDRGYAETSVYYQQQKTLIDEHLKTRLEMWRVHEEQRKALTQNVNAGLIRGFQDYFNEITNYNQFAYDSITKALTGMEDALVKFATTGKLSFGDMVNSMIADISRLAIRMAMTGMMQSWTGGGSGAENPGTMSSLFGGSWGFAKGAAFDATKFAKGGSFTNGIVKQPTLFSMGGAFGGLGKMGEAGPEAIVPLARTESGDLGIRAMGMGGSAAPNIIINNYSSAEDPQAEVDVDNMGNITVSLYDNMEKRLAMGMATGSGPLYNATKRRLNVKDR